MVELTLTNLKQAFSAALTDKPKFIAVAISIPGSPDPEVIINTRNNFESKLEYYKAAYNEDLTHRHAAGIKIIGITYANTFSDIQEDLLG